ncbi:MAG: hypothetical protein G8237_01220 [Magnetococcales bacterium]|nr:hypothetical protein [Magnetococcales bacterium]NGZ04957.1 hypothetical protein [Magnetococcales bacterium]
MIHSTLASLFDRLHGRFSSRPEDAPDRPGAGIPARIDAWISAHWPDLEEMVDTLPSIHTITDFSSMSNPPPLFLFHGMAEENDIVEGSPVYDFNADELGSDSPVPPPPLTFTITGADAGLFAIDASSGEVTWNSDQEFGEAESYTFTITASAEEEALVHEEIRLLVNDNRFVRTVTRIMNTDQEALTLTGSDNLGINGNALNNMLVGNLGANAMAGGEGDDTIRGEGGHDLLHGDAGNDTLNGGSGHDILFGDNGNDSLSGGSGNDRLDGGAGSDTLAGGRGNDLYVVDNTEDTITENANAGMDQVHSSITWILTDHLEELRLLTDTNINATGNRLDNTLHGNNGDNVLRGDGGRDLLNGNGGNDSLYGDDGNDTLSGGAGNDLLNGGAGMDRLVGGSGNDTYVMDGLKDRIDERANGGTDLVQSTISWRLDQHLENLTLTGTGNLRGSGNRATNLIHGNAGNNTLEGNEGNDTLHGEAGHDLLDGGSGADAMHGGSGDDRYLVDHSGDTVIEEQDGGTDLVTSSITWTLGDHVEHLTLTGSRNLSGTGNGLNNTLIGNRSANVLRGGAGNDQLDGVSGGDDLQGEEGDDILMGGLGADRLTGGAGADQFKFLSPEDRGDIMTDFTPAQNDQLAFVNRNFGNMATGPLDGSLLGVSATGNATTATERFLFNTTTGQLRYDPDGNGSRAAVTIATLNSLTTLSASQILIVAN